MGVIPPPAKWVKIEAQHHGVHQAARPRHHRRAAAGAAKDGNAAAAALFQPHFLGDAGRAAHHDHRRGRLPEPQDLVRRAGLFRRVEKGFVQRQVFRRRGEREVEDSHGELF